MIANSHMDTDITNTLHDLRNHREGVLPTLSLCVCVCVCVACALRPRTSGDGDCVPGFSVVRLW